MNEKDTAHLYPSKTCIIVPEQHGEPKHNKRMVALCIFLSISPGMLLVYPSAISMFAVFGSISNCSIFAFGGVFGTLTGILLKELNFRCSLICFHSFISLCWILTYLVTPLNLWWPVHVLLFSEGTAFGLILMMLHFHATKFPRAYRDNGAGSIEFGLLLGVLFVSLILGFLHVQHGLIVCFFLSLLSTVVAIVCIPTILVATAHDGACDLSSVEAKDPRWNSPKSANGTLLGQQNHVHSQDHKLLLLRIVEACLHSFTGFFLLHFIESLCMNFAASVIESYIVFSASAVLFAFIYQMNSSEDELGRELPSLVFTGALILLLVRSQFQFDTTPFVPLIPFGVIMIFMGLTVAVSLGQLYWLCQPPTTDISYGHEKVLFAWWLSGSIYLKLAELFVVEINSLTLIFILACIGLGVSLILYTISNMTSNYLQVAQ